MKFIIGLGNPEPKYSNNRHNVGFIVIDAMNAAFKTKYKRKAPVFSQKFLQSIVFDYSPFTFLAKPMKFMNDSGVAVKKIVDAYKINPKDVYIIHDDLDIPIGEYKIQVGKGPKVHNGIKSVEEELGTKDFGRIRIGIENRPARDASNALQAGNRIPGDEYVLADFTKEEERILKWTIQKLIHEEFFENLRYR
jgi:peptidyl-tRNA hydrolase, PTH1 family